MTERKFEDLVEEAISELPFEILDKMDNVSIIVEDFPSKEDMKKTGIKSPYHLFGLYVGVPLTKRTSTYGAVPPDVIIIYKKPLERAFRNENEIKRQVKITVAHEIAHHFGISEKRLRELGY
ncbi:MAG: metallopeptidase family protein [Acidobacteriota bacterium]